MVSNEARCTRYNYLSHLYQLQWYQRAGLFSAYKVQGRHCRIKGDDSLTLEFS